MDRHFYYLRHILGLTADESLSLSCLLARYNNYLNYRRVEGFRVLPYDTDKRCEYMRCVDGRCKRRAVVSVVMSYGDKYFSVYLCERHFEKFLENAINMFGNRIAKLYTKVMNAVFRRNVSYGIDLDGIEVVFREADQSQ